MWVLALAALAACAAGRGAGADAGANSSASDLTGAAGEITGARGKYSFYCDIGAERGAEGAAAAAATAASGTRRIFGGDAAELAVFPRVVALLDRYWGARCSGSAVATQWVLTAAHCVTSNVAYIKYNTRRPASLDGNFVPVHYLYRHPQFEVVQTRGAEPDVTLLHHDLGLVRTRNVMRLHAELPKDIYAYFRRYDSQQLSDGDIKVLGFGRTERSVLGEELFSARLRLAPCSHADWLHVICGSAFTEARGVCSGDSGGPVLYRDHQVGVTSMGPVECANAGNIPPVGATSVFTSLYPYSELVNATIGDTEAALRMRRLSGGPRSPRPPRCLLALAALLPIALLPPAR